MWDLRRTEEFERRLKRLSKRKWRELESVLNNLDTYLGALRAGAKPQHRPFGFMHPESHGVWALDQKGGGKNLAETRLYVYPDSRVELLHLITLGDKSSQPEDVHFCTEYVAELLIREPLENDKDRGQEKKDSDESEEAESC
jgi:hypothetical protein